MNKLLVGAKCEMEENANLTCVMIGFILKFFFRICIQSHNTEFDSDVLIADFNNIINECIKLLELKHQKIIRLIGDNDSEYDVPVVGNQCCCFF